VTARPSHQIKGDDVTKKGITRWTCSDFAIQAQKSKYGKRDFQLASNPVGPAKAWARGLDVEAIKRLADEMANMKREKQDMERPHQELRTKLEEARRKQRAVADDKASGPRIAVGIRWNGSWS
jgi:hypothetical protein